MNIWLTTDWSPSKKGLADILGQFDASVGTLRGTVQRHLETLSAAEIKALEMQISDYLLFRDDVHTFLSEHFRDLSTEKCYRNNLSACCSREGIITFFGDINALAT